MTAKEAPSEKTDLEDEGFFSDASASLTEAKSALQRPARSRTLTRKALLNIERSHDQAADNLDEAETDDISGGISDAQDKILSCPACRKTFHTAQKMDDHLACVSHSNEVERLLKLPHAVHRLSKTEIEWLSRNHKNGDRQPQTPPRSNSFNLRTFDKVEAGIETRASNLQLSLQGDTQAFSEELESMKRDLDQRDSLEPGVQTLEWPQLQRLRESGAAPEGKSFCKPCGKMMQSQFSFRQHIASHQHKGHVEARVKELETLLNWL